MSRPHEERATGEEELPSIDELANAGDAGALLELAKGYRASRDLKSCLGCYEAAAKLGSAEAEHAVGLFYLSGGVVPQDQKRAASLFRSAADRGYLPSRVYVANLYELGVHYKQDSEKADVWYRNAARTAQITDAAASPEYARAMAELGCVRYCIALIEDPASTPEERVYFTRKAKAHGWRERSASGAGAARASEPGPSSATDKAAAGVVAGPENSLEPPTLAEAEASSSAASAKDVANATSKADAAKKASKSAAKKRARAEATSRVGEGLVAFLWATLLVSAAVGAGYLGLEGVRVLVAHYGPVLGAHEERVVLGVAASLAVLGTLLVYTLKSVLKALLPAALFAALGWFTWSAPNLHLFRLHPAQAIAFGIAGYLAALLILGVGGGAKTRKT